MDVRWMYRWNGSKELCEQFILCGDWINEATDDVGKSIFLSTTRHRLRNLFYIPQQLCSWDECRSWLLNHFGTSIKHTDYLIHIYLMDGKLFDNISDLYRKLEELFHKVSVCISEEKCYYYAIGPLVQATKMVINCLLSWCDNIDHRNSILRKKPRNLPEAFAWYQYYVCGSTEWLSWEDIQGLQVEDDIGEVKEEEVEDFVNPGCDSMSKTSVDIPVFPFPSLRDISKSTTTFIAPSVRRRKRKPPYYKFKSRYKSNKIYPVCGKKRLHKVYDPAIDFDIHPNSITHQVDYTVPEVNVTKGQICDQKSFITKDQSIRNYCPFYFGISIKGPIGDLHNRSVKKDEKRISFDTFD